MMLFPFVSRSMHDECMALATRRADAEHENAQALRREYADLIGRYHMLRLQGAVTRVAEAARATPTPDPIQAAVTLACAGKDDRVRTAMLRQIAIDKAANLSTEAIIARIRRGTRPADEFTDVPSDAPDLTPTPSDGSPT